MYVSELVVICFLRYLPYSRLAGMYNFYKGALDVKERILSMYNICVCVCFSIQIKEKDVLCSYIHTLSFRKTHLIILSYFVNQNIDATTPLLDIYDKAPDKYIAL